MPLEVPLCVLQTRLARGEAVNQWAALRAAPTTRDLESVYYLTRTYFTKDQVVLRQEKAHVKLGTILQGKGFILEGENELPQRISVLKR